MKIDDDIRALHDEMTEWRRDLHAHPETAFEEHRTSAFVADKLKSFGIEVHQGLAGTGVVGVLRGRGDGRHIGLRADMDALDITERTNLPYRSRNPGKMHACGHDGHTAMLLAAGKHLAETKRFEGTLRLIFQPGEETMEGGPAMIQDGLFERFPVDAVFGMHNLPGLELGKLYFTAGDVMAAVDNWEIQLTGKGSHGAMPEQGIDPVVAGSSLVMALQSVVARNVAPAHRAVVTVGAFLAGNAGNVVANEAVLRLSIRTTTAADRELVLGRVRQLTQATAEGFGCTFEIREGVPGAVLTNDAEHTRKAYEIAREAFGDEQVVYPGPTYLSSEDFAFMLQKRPGTYCFLGNGATPMVHHPEYTFDRRILTKGAAYWVALAEGYLS